MSEKKNVYIAMPTFTGKPRIETLHCLMDLQDGLKRNEWDASWKFTVRDSMIFRTRNLFVADFYQRKEFTDLIMLDDDLSWEHDAVLRLLSHPVDVVAGIYPMRTEELKFPVKRLDDSVLPDSKGLLEVDKVPTGFLKISRDCIEKMVAHYHNTLCYQEDLVTGGRAWALFWFDLVPQQGTEIHQLTGEDFTFCNRWRAIGGKVYADTLLRFRHYGEKAYEGCYAEHIPGFLESLSPTSSAA